MGVRPYDPVLGRFLVVDPVEGGSANYYDYAGQDPINGFDLTGRAMLADIFGSSPGAAALVGAAVAAAFLAASPGWYESLREACGGDLFGCPGAFVGQSSDRGSVVTYASEHTKDARPSTKGKHQKGQKRKKQVDSDKKRRHETWKDYSNKRR